MTFLTRAHSFITRQQNQMALSRIFSLGCPLVENDCRDLIYNYWLASPSSSTSIGLTLSLLARAALDSICCCTYRTVPRSSVAFAAAFSLSPGASTGRLASVCGKLLCCSTVGTTVERYPIYGKLLGGYLLVPVVSNAVCSQPVGHQTLARSTRGPRPQSTDPGSLGRLTRCVTKSERDVHSWLLGIQDENLGNEI